MFDVGAGELAVVAVVVLAAVVLWHTWRPRWVRIAREWHLDLTARDVDEVLAESFMRAGGRLRAGGDGTWIHTVSRVPAWAIVIGVLTLPIGLLLIALVREHADLTLRVVPEGTGCRLRLVGRAPASTLISLESLVERLGPSADEAPATAP